MASAKENVDFDTSKQLLLNLCKKETVDADTHKILNLAKSFTLVVSMNYEQIPQDFADRAQKGMDTNFVAPVRELMANMNTLMVHGKIVERGAVQVQQQFKDLQIKTAIWRVKSAVRKVSALRNKCARNGTLSKYENHIKQALDVLYANLATLMRDSFAAGQEIQAILSKDKDALPGAEIKYCDPQMCRGEGCPYPHKEGMVPKAGDMFLLRQKLHLFSAERKKQRDLKKASKKTDKD